MYFERSKKLRLIQRTRSVLATLVALVAASCQEIPTDTLRLLTLDIEAPSTSLEVGETLQLGVSAATPAGARLELVGLNWMSSDPSILTVTDGRVSGVLPGQAYVRAYIAGIADSLQVTVRQGASRSRSSGVLPRGGCWEARGSPLGPTTIC